MGHSNDVLSKADGDDGDVITEVSPVTGRNGSELIFGLVFPFCTLIEHMITQIFSQFFNGLCWYFFNVGFIELLNG